MTHPNEPDRRALTTEQISKAVRWLQLVRKDIQKGRVAEIYESELDHIRVLEQCGDDALEAANARDKEIEEHERDWSGYKVSDPLQHTGWQPEDPEEDRRTATVVQDLS